MSFLFSERLHCYYIYFHCSYLYMYDNYSRNVVLEMLSFTISYLDLIKFPYFADTIETGVWGWKEAQREGDFTDFSVESKSPALSGSCFSRELSVLASIFLKIWKNPWLWSYSFIIYLFWLEPLVWFRDQLFKFQDPSNPVLMPDLGPCRPTVSSSKVGPSSVGLVLRHRSWLELTWKCKNRIRLVKTSKKHAIKAAMVCIMTLST